MVYTIMVQTDIIDNVEKHLDQIKKNNTESMVALVSQDVFRKYRPSTK